jgi:hypothetical protein
VTDAAARLAAFGADATTVTSTGYTYERADAALAGNGGR